MADEDSKIENERTLAKIVALKGVLSVEEAVAIILQLVKAVGELHVTGKVHRQIHAGAVHIDQNESAKLDPVKPEVSIGGIGVDLVPCPPPKPVFCLIRAR